MFYIKVAVFSRTEKLDDLFTYCSEDKVEIGQVVKIPLKTRDIFGIVVENESAKPSFSVRPIKAVLEINVPKHLIETAKFLSNYYHSPISATLKSMLPQGFHKKRRDIKDKPKNLKKVSSFKLTKDQENAVQLILKNQKPTLLFGVTGSGKTEVYMAVIDEILKENKSAIVLVPEISLTPQTTKRFEERFPNNVVVMHSGMKETDRQKNWDLIRSDNKSIIIGPRSAVFSPVQNLGAIIIDEEHDSSYKQESTPRYDARKIAEFIAQKTNAKLILGSATPRIETFHQASKGKFELVELKRRITENELPKVEIIDLREEYQKNNYSSISFALEKSLKETLKQKRKAILFLNRRGNATYVFCRDCGFVINCPNCEIPLTHHFTEKENLLKCHHCDHKEKIPLKCPNCSGLAIKYYGLAIQRVENELRKLFPEAKIIRMDKDTTVKRESYQEIFDDFSKKESGILLGTQMVTKGWDIEEVDLVGVISADNALNFPDFRANEKTYQLLSQVSGRPGRKDNQGLALIQTFNPENPVMEFVKNHNYEGFYKKEILEREKYSYPPFTTLVRLIYKNTDFKKAEMEAKKLKLSLEEELKKGYNKQVVIQGPSPCFLSKLNGNFRWHMVLKIKDDKALEILRQIPSNWTIDVDPVNLI